MFNKFLTSTILAILVLQGAVSMAHTIPCGGDYLATDQIIFFRPEGPVLLYPRPNRRHTEARTLHEWRVPPNPPLCGLLHDNHLGITGLLRSIPGAAGSARLKSFLDLSAYTTNPEINTNNPRINTNHQGINTNIQQWVDFLGSDGDRPLNVPVNEARQQLDTDPDKLSADIHTFYPRWPSHPGTQDMPQWRSGAGKNV
ncbi:hypothetical protein C8R45DRAFT_1079168 [Mycena sanguinolenta]|nr:hypothetical protein C8R45DRAFT_1079168 [Mycena sanguinolenta]